MNTTSFGQITRGYMRKWKMPNNKKIVKVDFTNPEGRMKLSITNKHGDSTDTAIKIMKAFDETCDEIRKEEECKK